MELSAGARLGPYEIRGLVGRGGMGEVYRAHDPRLGRDVALKVLPARFAENPYRLRRFSQEARSAGALNHPNIVDVHDLGEAEGLPYVVLELLEGETLAHSPAPRAGRVSGARSRSACRSRAGSPRRTRRESSTVTSSPRTCSSPGTGS